MVAMTLERHTSVSQGIRCTTASPVLARRGDPAPTPYSAPARRPDDRFPKQGAPRFDGGVGIVSRVFREQAFQCVPGGAARVETRVGA